MSEQVKLESINFGLLAEAFERQMERVTANIADLAMVLTQSTQRGSGLVKTAPNREICQADREKIGGVLNLIKVFYGEKRTEGIAPQSETDFFVWAEILARYSVDALKRAIKKHCHHSPDFAPSLSQLAKFAAVEKDIDLENEVKERETAALVPIMVLPDIKRLLLKVMADGRVFQNWEAWKCFLTMKIAIDKELNFNNFTFTDWRRTINQIAREEGFFNDYKFQNSGLLSIPKKEK